jgi:Uma2 family endonuclease
MLRNVDRPIVRKHPATYADVEAAPEHVVAELIDGTLYITPRPSPPSARATSTLCGELGRRFDRDPTEPPGWVILFQPELHLVGQALVPDLAGWRRARMQQLPKVAALEIAPDWVCEVSSAPTAALDRKIKLPKYAQAGVERVWIIDADAQTLEVLRVTQDRLWETAVVFSEDDRVRAEPFEAHELELAALWRW